MLTAKIKPIQLIKIKIAVKDKNKIFLYELNISKKSLNLFKIIVIINKNIKDHNPLWIATSIGEICFISLKTKGWGKPQNNEAKQV